MTITIRNGGWRTYNYARSNLDNMLGNRPWENVLGRFEGIENGIGDLW